MKMMMRGRKERRMKGKMTNGTLMDSNLPFLIFFSPWEQVAVFFFPFSFSFLLLCSFALFFEVSFFSPFIPWFSAYFGGKYLEQNTVGKESLPLFVPNSFLSLPVSTKTKTLWNQHHRALWEKRKTFCSLSSAGSWRVLGPCVVVHRILAFFLLSLYIGLRDYTVSLCEYGQLAFTNMYLSTFSCLKKRKKNFKKMGL